MKLPRDLSGIRLTRHLCRAWRYKVVHQTGSHMVLQTETPGHHRIVVPAHKALRIGTLNSSQTIIQICFRYRYRYRDRSMRERQVSPCPKMMRSVDRGEVCPQINTDYTGFLDHENRTGTVSS